jgi:hypothetical protein
MFCYVVVLLLCYFCYYVMCSLLVICSLLGYVFFVSLSILIVMYVPFGVIVLLCVLFVCECVLDNCHRDIGPLFDYPNSGFSVLFPPGYNSQRRGTARTSRFTSQFFVLLIVMCAPSSVFCVLFVCKCVLYYCHRVSTKLQFYNNNNNNKHVPQIYILPSETAHFNTTM